MFFPELIRSIGPSDRVLEIGPGGTPHPRSDVLLEHRFDEDAALLQRGGTPSLMTSKEMVFYDGGAFPFRDNEFDYVICSHVVEHVKDVDAFCSEMFRVAKRGYLEFPTIFYEYLYNFSVHLQLIGYRSGELLHMSKESSGLNAFSSVQAVFYHSLELGYSDLVEDMKSSMFVGFEWTEPFKVRRVASIDELAREAPGPHPLTRRARYARRLLRLVSRS